MGSIPSWRRWYPSGRVICYLVGWTHPCSQALPALLCSELCLLCFGLCILRFPPLPPSSRFDQWKAPLEMGGRREQKPGLPPSPPAFCKVYMVASPQRLLLQAGSPAVVPSPAGWSWLLDSALPQPLGSSTPELVLSRRSRSLKVPTVQFYLCEVQEQAALVCGDRSQSALRK